MTLGDKIRIRREEAGLSQDELAQKLGYKSRSTIAKLESGVNDLTQSKLKAFADALNTTVGDLLDWDEDKNDKPEEKKAYYLDPETARIAQELHDNPGQRILFDASKDLTPDDIKVVMTVINGLKKKEGSQQ
jgi:transcriptional regulator with XRE-family HTH domain